MTAKTKLSGMVKNQNLEDELQSQKELQKRSFYASEQLDKAIVYLAGGSLVFSVGFIEKIVTITKCTNTKLLLISWMLFAGTLIINLLSHITSRFAMDFNLDQTKKVAKNFDIATRILNGLSILTLITGLSLFVIFINNNLANV